MAASRSMWSSDQRSSAFCSDCSMAAQARSSLALCLAVADRLAHASWKARSRQAKRKEHARSSSGAQREACLRVDNRVPHLLENRPKLRASEPAGARRTTPRLAWSARNRRQARRAPATRPRRNEAVDFPVKASSWTARSSSSGSSPTDWTSMRAASMARRALARSPVARP